MSYNIQTNNVNFELWIVYVMINDIKTSKNKYISETDPPPPPFHLQRIKEG